MSTKYCHAAKTLRHHIFPRLKLGLGLDLSVRLGSPPPRIACLHQYTPISYIDVMQASLATC